jgi:hypothetical protein
VCVCVCVCVCVYVHVHVCVCVCVWLGGGGGGGTLACARACDRESDDVPPHLIHLVAPFNPLSWNSISLKHCAPNRIPDERTAHTAWIVVVSVAIPDERTAHTAWIVVVSVAKKVVE